MAKQRSPLTDYLVYVVFRLTLCVLQALPIDFTCWLADLVGDIAFHLLRRRRETTIDNLRHAFPGRYSEAEFYALARRVYRHFALSCLEATLMPRKVTATTMDKYLDRREFAGVKEVIDSGRPVIVLTAHFGNWELAAHCLGLAGVRAALVGRPLDNQYIDRWLRAWRELTGHNVLSKKGDVRRMTEVLLSGGTLCTLGDQDAGATGMFVDFFGRPASTHKAIARLALRTGAVIAVVGMQKTGGFLEYAIRVMDMIKPEDHEGQLDATFAITQRFAAAVEQMVRLDPVQYFWLHRRWKHQPPMATLAAAA